MCWGTCDPRGQQTTSLLANAIVNSMTELDQISGNVVKKILT